jgi:hypothetical protein
MMGQLLELLSELFLIAFWVCAILVFVDIICRTVFS